MRGKDFIISIDIAGVKTPICYAVDCVFDFTYSTRRIIDPSSRWRDHLADDISYTIQVPGIVVYTSIVNWVQLKQWADAGAKLTWHASAYPNGGYSMTGTMLITTLNKTSQLRDKIKFDMSAIGCKAAQDVFTPIITDVYLADSSMQRLAGCPNPYPVSVYWYNADGTGPGTLIGVAFNADDVMNLYNNHSENEYFQLTGYTSGCDFSLKANWDVPFVPSVIFAAASPELGLWSGEGDEGISPDQDNDELLSPEYA